MSGIALEILRMLIEEDLAEALDGSQRRSQIVRDRIAEGFQLRICVPQLCREALLGRDLLAQIAVESFQPAVRLGIPALGHLERRQSFAEERPRPRGRL